MNMIVRSAKRSTAHALVPAKPSTTSGMFDSRCLSDIDAVGEARAHHSRFPSSSLKLNPKKTDFSAERYGDRRRRSGPSSQGVLCTERDSYRQASVVI